MLLFAEFIGLMGVVPLILLYFKQRLLVIAALWLAAIVTFIFLRKKHALVFGTDWNAQAFRQGWRFILKRFLILGSLLTALVAVFLPDLFLSMPKQRPNLWAAVMFIYPVLSVWPQEMVYRTFIFRRYQPFFDKISFPILSAAAFGFVHILFLNPVAILLTASGGYMFARTYEKSRSLALVCFEHALYGCLIFTIGLGRFFFLGTAWEN